MSLPHPLSLSIRALNALILQGSITVGSLLPTWGIIVAAGAGATFIGGAIIAGGVYFAQTHPGSSIANIFSNVRL